MNLNALLDLVGFSRHPISPRDNLLSLLGGLLGIYLVYWCSHQLLSPENAIYIIPSMGASAVLLFAAPHAPFSQPWNVLGGHLISSLIGVTCWLWIPEHILAASASVGLAIGAMYFTRCIHPPGGATALAFVIGSEQLHALGFSYVLYPALLNTLLILLAAIIFNSPFKWRRYPAHLNTSEKFEEQVAAGYPPINHEDFVYALSHIDTLVDIDEKELLKIYALATKRHVESNTA